MSCDREVGWEEVRGDWEEGKVKRRGGREERGGKARRRWRGAREGEPEKGGRLGETDGGEGDEEAGRI